MEKHFQLSSAQAETVHVNERSRFIGLGQFSTLSTWVIPNFTQRFFSPQACVKQLRCFLRQIVALMPHNLALIAKNNLFAASKLFVIHTNTCAWEFKNDR